MKHQHFQPTRIKIMAFDPTRGRGHARVYMPLGMWVCVGVKVSMHGRLSLELPSAVFAAYHGFPLSPTVGLDREMFSPNDLLEITKAWTAAVVAQLRTEGHGL